MVFELRIENGELRMAVQILTDLSDKKSVRIFSLNSQFSIIQFFNCSQNSSAVSIGWMRVQKGSKAAEISSKSRPMATAVSVLMVAVPLSKV